MQKVMTLCYGSVVYAVFLGTFLYAIGFVGNLWVPKSIDSGEAGPLGPSLLINTLLLGLFGLQHTGMARQGFKRWWTKIIPRPIERATYVLATNVALILMYWQWRPLPGVVWQVENPAGQVLLQGLFWTGWLIMLLATFMIHHFDLFGLRQVWLHFRGARYSELGFRTPGFYEYLRHPIQVGFLVAFWATPTMTVGHLTFSVVTTAYIFVAVKLFEERDLVKHFGDTYRRYMDQVAGFVPMGKYRPPVPSPKPAARPAAFSAGD